LPAIRGPVENPACCKKRSVISLEAARGWSTTWAESFLLDGVICRNLTPQEIVKEQFRSHYGGCNGKLFFVPPEKALQQELARRILSLSQERASRGNAF